MHKWTMHVIVVMVVLIAWPVFAEESTAPSRTATPRAQFDVSPNRCVTLRQGQPCFVRVQFKWQSSEAIAVCLHDMQGKNIKCWQTSLGGSIVLPQTLPTTTEYILVDAEGLELNRASVSVSWVYRKKRSKRRWRLF